jgi:N-terminal domain of galactosyltransferase
MITETRSSIRPVHFARMSLKVKLGALLYDVPRFLGTRNWVAMRNRNERLTLDGRGARCEWEYTSELHVANVFPRAGARLMERAFRDWPLGWRRDAATTAGVDAGGPLVSFVIGHRGLARLPHLLATLRSIAGQRNASVECVVVEQSAHPEIASQLPAWVRYLHTPTTETAYNRSWTLNAGARAASGEVLILHDNDMICPADYAAEALARAKEGWAFQQLKRFTFYLSERDTQRAFDTGEVRTNVASTVVQNLHGASIAVSRDAYFDIGGFDESFVGWGGEDNEFWDRAETTGRVYGFGYLPFIHLWHAPQPAKQLGNDAPAVRRWHELKNVPAAERIAKLRERL